MNVCTPIFRLHDLIAQNPIQRGSKHVVDFIGPELVLIGFVVFTLLFIIYKISGAESMSMTFETEIGGAIGGCLIIILIPTAIYTFAFVFRGASNLDDVTRLFQSDLGHVAWFFGWVFYLVFWIAGISLICFVTYWIWMRWHKKTREKTTRQFRNRMWTRTKKAIKNVVSDLRAAESAEETTPSHVSQRFVHQLVIECLCCVMVADEVTGPKELAGIHSILSKVGPQMTSVEIDEVIEEYLAQIKISDQETILQKTEQSLRDNSDNINGVKTILRALELVAEADGNVSPEESEIYERFQTILAPTLPEPERQHGN